MPSQFYVDTSALLDVLFQQKSGKQIQHTLADNAQQGGQLVSLRLLQLELVRALRREGASTAHADAALHDFDLLPIDDAVLREAESIRPHCKSLDAIHLATCLTLSAPPTLITTDTRMADLAQQLGLRLY